MPLTCVPAGQGLVRRVWQVQDSNLRRHTPTDLQSESPNLLTSAVGEVRGNFRTYSARLPGHSHRQPDNLDLLEEQLTLADRLNGGGGGDRGCRLSVPSSSRVGGTNDTRRECWPGRAGYVITDARAPSPPMLAPANIRKGEGSARWGPPAGERRRADRPARLSVQASDSPRSCAWGGAAGGRTATTRLGQTAAAPEPRHPDAPETARAAGLTASRLPSHRFRT
jgi:hypothetical protein